eukprot:g47527.t1
MVQGRVFLFPEDRQRSLQSQTLAGRSKDATRVNAVSAARKNGQQYSMKINDLLCSSRAPEKVMLGHLLEPLQSMCLCLNVVKILLHLGMVCINAILQLIRFILNHNAFTFNNQFFIQTHRTAMGTKFARQYANIFMHKFKQDFITAQDLRPMLYTRYINNIFFLWTHGEESLKQLHSDVNKFHPTIRFSLQNQSLSWTHKTNTKTDRVPFIVQYIPREERLRHVLRNLQHVIDDDKHLAKIVPMPTLLAFKQPPNLKLTIVCLQDNINHNTTQPCHSNHYKTYGNVPSQWGNTSAVKGIQPLIFGEKAFPVYLIYAPHDSVHLYKVTPQPPTLHGRKSQPIQHAVGKDSDMAMALAGASGPEQHGLRRLTACCWGKASFGFRRRQLPVQIHGGGGRGEFGSGMRLGWHQQQLHRRDGLEVDSQCQKRFTRMLPGMECLSYKERLDRLRLYSLERCRLRGDLIEAYKIMRGIDRVN